jgi:uncharacterized protein (UPF0261 family)
MAKVGEEVARRLQHTKGEAIFVIPNGGFDSYAVEGKGFYDPEADRAFVEALKANLPSNIQVLERDTHIEDPEFASWAALLLIGLIEKKNAVEGRTAAQTMMEA